MSQYAEELRQRFLDAVARGENFIWRGNPVYTNRIEDVPTVEQIDAERERTDIIEQVVNSQAFEDKVIEIAGEGGGGGPLWTPSDVSGAVAPTTGDSGTLYNFSGAGSLAVPDVTGFSGELRFAVAIRAVIGVGISVLGGGKIEFITTGGTPVSSSAIFASAKGCFISIIHVGSNIWQAMELIGPWADDS